MIKRYLLGTVGLCIIAGMAPAQVFYGTTGQGGAASSLYTINSSTGATTLVGATGFSGVGAIAFNPAGTTLYGIAGNAVGPSAHSLITINTSTGAGTLIGGLGASINFTDMSFRSDGVLFAMTASGTLYTVNTTSGAATSVGNGGNISSGGGLAFNSSNTLYLANGQELQTVNTSTGAQTNVTPLTFPANTDSMTGMKFSTGTLYGTAFALDSAPNSELVSINTTTGGVTNLGVNGVRLEAFAVGSGVSAPPPPPSGAPIPSSLLLLGTGLCCLAVWLYMGRRSGAHAA